MIALVLSGTVNALPSGENLSLDWNNGGTGGANPLGNGAASIAYSAAVSAGDVEQLGILIFPTVTTAIVARIQWSADGANWVEEMLEQPSAVSGGVQQFAPVIKEWGPSLTKFPLWRPVTAVYFRLGIYSNGVPGSTDSVTTYVLLQRPEQLQAAGS